MTDERTTGFAELKAVALDILQSGRHQPGAGQGHNDQESQHMQTRDPHRSAPDDARAENPPGHDRQPQGVPESDPQGRAGGREDPALATGEDRQQDAGAGAEAATTTDANHTSWPPADWNAQGNAHRHGQEREGHGPGGYEDRSRELRDFGPGPEGSTTEAWRTYENADAEDGDKGEDTDPAVDSGRD